MHKTDLVKLVEETNQEQPLSEGLWRALKMFVGNDITKQEFLKKELKPLAKDGFVDGHPEEGDKVYQLAGHSGYITMTHKDFPDAGVVILIDDEGDISDVTLGVTGEVKNWKSFRKELTQKDLKNVALIKRELKKIQNAIDKQNNVAKMKKAGNLGVKESLVGLLQNTLNEGLSPVAKKRADFNKKLKNGELDDLTKVAKRVDVLMDKNNGLSFKDASKQAIKDVTKVDVKTLEEYMDLYKGEY